ncbi:MAG TPA: leucine-rich repeat protein [Candidatus Saccharimonadales bacterium]|nr:leucine-rich repeat protein [Candidatus Saccharimonadales bacterium]
MNSDLHSSSRSFLHTWPLVLLLLAALPAALQAQYTFTTQNGTTIITGYSGGGSIVIPDTLGGFPVTAIAPYAFNQAGTLTGVTMGTNLTTIGTNAFFQCLSLGAIAFTSSVTNIGDGPLYDCTSVTSITMSGTNNFITVSNSVIFNKSQTYLIQFPGGVTASYTIPASVTNVGEAFIGNRLSSISADATNTIYSSLNGVLFDKTQTQLIAYPGSASGSYAVPSTVTIILGSSFEYSINLASVAIGPGVTNIGYAAFFDSSALSSLNVNSGNAYYSSSNGVFFNKAQTQLIQYPIAVAGSYAVPGTVTNIIDGSFGDALGLTSVVIPNSVTYIGLEAFYFCPNLSSVSIGNSVTNIGQEAFFDCNSLNSVVIPASVKTLSAYAFGDCQILTNVCFEGNAPVDGGSVFYYDLSLANVLFVNGASGWTTYYDGFPTAPCASCGSVVTQPSPQLNIARSGNNVILTWLTNSPGFTLQSATNIVQTNWSTVNPSPVAIGNQYTVTNAITGSRTFYRLVN